MTFRDICQKIPQTFKQLSTERFSTILGGTSERAYSRAQTSLLALTVLSIVAQWAVAPVPLVASPPDVMGFIDAGYRVTSGQVPHNDFSSQLGPVFSYVYAIGVSLFGPTIPAVVSSNLLVMTLTTSLAWLLSRKRLNPLLALIFSATVMTTTSGVVPLGWGAHETDYAMSYNRHAFGILMCICVVSFFQKQGSSSMIVERVENLIIGALVSLLLLLKLNFFVIGVCALLIGQFFAGLNFKKSAWIFSGFLIPIVFFWFVLGVKPGAFFDDMLLLYNVVKETRPSLFGPVWKLISQLTVPISMVLFTIVATGWLCLTSQKGDTNSLVRAFISAVFLLAADLVLGVSNTQLPILVFPPFIALIALRELLLVDNYRSIYLSALIIFTFSFSILTIVRETSYIVCALSSELSADPNDVEAQRFDSPLLKNVYVPSGLNVWSDYPQRLNDGLKLLRKHVTPSTKLVTLNIVNPFNFALGLKPTTGTQLYWWPGASYTEKNHLHAEQVFSNADMVIIDKYNFVVLTSYKSYLNKQFKLLEQTPYWFLLRRDNH
ncbi:hypothetical protein [Geobacter sp. AOG2]|uniref:hypothetical protein n=1 Tax=Geobacter sp. AOG2 TaxID=1566347 RepID=UPI001CC80AC2|nr:hypothetical protein [Geobacter sp. AOG2]GFE62153.1 hypothetical protein AOG2_27410 [Geobacter sp. AOG2]